MPNFNSQGTQGFFQQPTQNTVTVDPLNRITVDKRTFSNIHEDLIKGRPINLKVPSPQNNTPPSESYNNNPFTPLPIEGINVENEINSLFSPFNERTNSLPNATNPNDTTVAPNGMTQSNADSNPKDNNPFASLFSTPGEANNAPAKNDMPPGTPNSYSQQPTQNENQPNLDSVKSRFTELLNERNTAHQNYVTSVNSVAQTSGVDPAALASLCESNEAIQILANHIKSKNQSNRPPVSNTDPSSFTSGIPSRGPSTTQSNWTGRTVL